MKNIDRLLGEVYWVELPKLIEDFFDQMNADEFYSWSAEFVNSDHLVKEIIDTMVRNQIENYWNADHFQQIQRERNKSENSLRCKISKSDAIRLCLDLNLDEIQNRLGGHFQHFVDRIPTDKWIHNQEIQNHDPDQVENLHEVWLLYGRMSVLSPYLEEHRNGIWS